MVIENEVWSEIKITVGTKDIEVAGNIANMVVPYGIYIEDYSDLENEVMEIAHIDLIEESLLEADRSKGIIHVYVNPHENPIEAVSFIEERLKEQDIEYSIQIDDCATEDWVNNWKQYFHPMPIGEKLLIRPTWEREATRQQNYALKHLKNTLTKIQQFLISAAAAVFFLSLPYSSEQKVPLALISTRLQLKQRRQTHLKTALTKANSRQFRAICQTR